MNLNLTRPLVFFDLETTGTNIVTDRIIEISILRIEPGGKEEIRSFRINPGIPIPPASTAIHGIKDEDVRDKPFFPQVARNLAHFMEGCDIAGYNSNKFDIPLLAEEFLRAEVDFDMKNRKLIDVQVIFHKMEQRTLGAAYKFYCNKDLTDAHSSRADTTATYEILKAQLEKYPDLKNDMKYLNEFSAQNRNVDFAGRIIYDEEDVEIFNFGKYKGRPVREVFMKDPGYYSWILTSEFPLYTKKVLTAIKLRALTSGK